MEDEQKKLLFQWLLPLACVTVIVTIMFIRFSIEIKEDAVVSVENDMKEITEKFAMKISSDLQCIETAGRLSAQAIGEKASGDEAVVKHLLQAAVDQTPAYEAVYCDEKGMAVNAKGEYIDLDMKSYNEVVDDHTRPQYYYLPSEDALVYSKLLIVVPVGKDKGNLILYYPLKRINELVNTKDKFGQNAFTAMVDGQGTILQPGIVGSNFLKGENIWESVDKGYQSDAVKARVKMSNMTTGSVALSSDGEERTLVYSSIGVNGWSLVIGVDKEYVKNAQDRIRTKTIKMLCQLLGVMMLFYVLFAISNYLGKKKNAERSRNLQEKADTDLLTGLNNKLATERKIKEYMRENANSLGMLFVLDIDNFKKINDTMGHVFGDEVLRTLGKHIGANFRVTDIIGRTGGDEFMIFLKDLKDDADTLHQAEKLVKFFHGFQAGEYVKYSATASIGAAVFPDHGSDFESLYKSADKALYKAKERGKNQLAFYDDRDRRE
ncbi:GGDEF domain-containing protein [Lachnospiraceae bacterium]|jgi:diguanylate cyclase (GGDEF) domain|nr:GGDEF domain-containing protein [Lachnospiraceae bacterium]